MVVGSLRGGRQGRRVPCTFFHTMCMVPYAGGGKDWSHLLCGRQLPYAGSGKDWSHPLCGRQLPCAGGGKGRPRPLHPRPGALPLGTPI